MSDSVPFPEGRYLTPQHPRQRYESTAARACLKGLHFGQRKLLLSEIEYLSFLELRRAQQQGGAAAAPPRKPTLVVYAGAANGSHLPTLFRMFPTVAFVLVDPAPFCQPVCDTIQHDPKNCKILNTQSLGAQGSEYVSAAAKEGFEAFTTRAKTTAPPVVEIVNTFCTDELCTALADRYGATHELHLISDVRCGDPRTMTRTEASQCIIDDNAMQLSWAKTLRAATAMFKYHPPYPPCTDKTSKEFDPTDESPVVTTYVAGVSLFGVWAPKSSTEVRLVLPDVATAPTREWDGVEFEEQLYSYNVNARHATDCAAERSILRRYLEATGAAASDDAVAAVSREMSAALGYPLFTPLEPGYSEDHSRLCAFLYDADAAKAFADLRPHVTVSGVRAGPGVDHGDAAAAEAYARFWALANPKRLTAFYVFDPRVHARGGKRNRA